ncbi:MAG: cytochrome c, partial [Proteobacteria bacterium]|nr:cytochrome c [Pseudomonadota bacterium]
MKKAFLLLFSSTLIWASDSAPRMVVHMLNYIAKDYSGAVGPDGKVLSEFEYQEQKEFVQRIVDSSLTVSNLKEPQIQIKLHQLQKLIDKKAPPHLVKQLSESISENIIQKTALLVAPVHQVNLTNGKTQYDRNCAQCHGVDGAGDGPASGNFNPPPTNLKGSKLSGTSPFQLFNTIKLGVPGTAMASFDYLTDAEVWDIAHYVNSLIPKNEEASTVGSVSAALRYLDGAYWSYSQSDFQSAKTQAIEAYLEGVEPLEPRLRAIDLAFTNELEQSLMLFRQAIDKRLPSPAVKERLEHCNILLNRVEKVLAKKPSSAA